MSTCSCQTTPPNLQPERLTRLAEVFKALSHPVRVRIISLLIDGEKCVCELHDGTGKDISTISSHLNVLRAAGLVTSEQRGRNVYYSLCFPCLGQVLSCLNTHLD